MSNLKKVIAMALILICSLSLGASERPVFALVLSGGGARGIAHIAVIEELEKRGIVPDMVIGTSIGALIGGFYSAGYTASEIEHILMDTDILGMMLRLNNEGGISTLMSPDSKIRDNILSLNISPDGIGANNGLLDDQELGGFFRRNLAKVLGIENFDSLSIPFRAIGIDAVTGEEIIFSDGSLYTAMRASMSLPIVYAPVKTDDGRYVMDGGMANNLPVDVALDMGADYVLAVDVNDVFNRNNRLTAEMMETFTGSFDAFTTVISITNSIPKYEMADWVLVPPVNEFSTTGFDEKEEILRRGRANVEDNMAVFDEISSILEGRIENEFVRYSERPAYAIERINLGGISGYDREIYSFLGRALDAYTMEEFEKVLERIVSQERMKHISYRINGGEITLIPTYYTPSKSLITIGLSGDIGFKYNGVNDVYFSFLPFVSAGAGSHISEDDYLSLGLIFDDTLSSEIRYSRAVIEKGFVYAGLDVEYLNKSYNTEGSSYGNTSRSDFGSKISAGFFYHPERKLSADASVGFEYSHLARVLNQEDYSAEDIEASTDINSIYVKASLSYNTLDRENIFSKGLYIDASLMAGMDYAPNGYSGLKSRPLLSYDIAIDAEYAFGAYDFLNIIELEAESIRRYPKLSDGYRSTRTGIRTPDYVYLHSGIRSHLGYGSYHYSAGPYFEAYKSIPEKNSDYYKKRISDIPFSGLDSISLGVQGSVGVNTDFGEIYAEIYLGFGRNFTSSVSLGIR